MSVGMVIAAVCAILLVVVAGSLANQNRKPVEKTAPAAPPGPGGKKIDGHAVVSDDDWKRWWTKKWFTDRIFEHLSELEKIFESGEVSEEKAKSALDDWFSYYEKYRTVCLECGIWNMLVEPNTPFVGNEDQLKIEDLLKKENVNRFRIASKYRDEHKKYTDRVEECGNYILAHLDECPDKSAPRTAMIRKIAEQTNADARDVKKMYYQLIDDGMISEEMRGNRYYAKKTSRKTPRPPKLEKVFKLPPSVYDPACYAKVEKEMLYKVEYTVGKPINVDRETNTCEFISESNGERYYTSLSKCTCSSYRSPLSPCKHMIALAIELGYYDPKNVLRS